MELKEEFISTKKKTLCDGVKRPRKGESKIKLHYKPFGRFVINRQLLMDENTVLIKYPQSHGPVAQFKRKIVSNNVKSLLIDLVDTGEINIELLKQIESEEDVQYLEQLLKKAMIDKQIGYKKYIPDIDYYIEKFNMLKGSIEAGNDNVEVKQKLIDIIHLLSNPAINKISQEDAKFLIEFLVECLGEM